jgi:transcription elongation factor/antiterminator RfaH
MASRCAIIREPDTPPRGRAVDVEYPGRAFVAQAADEGSVAHAPGRWYVAHTQPHAESRAIFHLARQGYDVFCPRYARLVRHARRRTRVLAPLFPNYLFLNLDISRDRWRSVNGTSGVVRLIMQGERPQAVPRGIVEALKNQTDAGGVMEWTPSFRIGQAVEVADGPFEGLVGTLERLDAAGRVRVLLDLLGRFVSVGLDLQALAPAA